MLCSVSICCFFFCFPSAAVVRSVCMPHLIFFTVLVWYVTAASASAGGVPGSTYAPQPGYAPPGSVAGVSGAAPASTGLPYTSPMSVVQPTAKRPRTMQAVRVGIAGVGRLLCPVLDSWTSGWCAAHVQRSRVCVLQQCALRVECPPKQAAPSPPQQSEGYTAVLSSLVLRDVSDTVEPDVFDAAGAFTRFVTAHVTVGGTAGAPPVKADITLHASSKWGQNVRVCVVQACAVFP